MSIEIDDRASGKVEEVVDLCVGVRHLVLVGVEEFEVLDVELCAADLDLLGDFGRLGHFECILAVVIAL